MTVPMPSLRSDSSQRPQGGRRSLDAPSPELATPPAKREARLSMSQANGMASHGASHNLQTQRHNLDYLSLSSTPAQSRRSPQMQSRLHQLVSHQQSYAQLTPDLYSTAQLQQKLSGVSAAEWEALLGSMDGGQVNVYDAIYGGPGLAMTETPRSATNTVSNASAWSPDSWDLTNFNLGDFGAGPAPPRSVLSISEESLSSGEEVAPSELGLSVASSMDYAGGGIMAPCSSAGGDHLYVDPLEGFL